MTELEQAAIEFARTYEIFGPHKAPYGKGPKIQVDAAWARLRAAVVSFKEAQRQQGSTKEDETGDTGREKD